MSDFASRLDQAAAMEDGIAVARLLSITDESLMALGDYTNEAMVDRTIRKPIRDRQWGEIAVCHWRVAQQVVKYQNPKQAYVAQNALLVAVNKAAERADNWVLPVMFLVAKELRQLSIMADSQDSPAATPQEPDSKEKSHSVNLEEATRTINRSFTICLNDRNTNLETSKKWGVYFFVGELFKIYFKLNKRSLATSVVKVLTSMRVDLPPLETYPKSHSTTFHFYSGVLHFIDEDYTAARESLTKALSQCHRSAARNKELILMYLVPAQFLALRRTPSDALWARYPNLEYLYRDMFGALLHGDVRAFDAAMLARRRVLVRKYLYLAAERIQALVYTRLFKKVYLVMEHPTRVSIELLSKALLFAGGKDQDTSSDQVECYLTDMIYSGRMKGYISRERQTLVLSSKDAFPKQIKA